jgi:hypothetical protein
VTPDAVPTSTHDVTAIERVRRANWTAIAVATVLMMASMFSYAAAFVDADGEVEGIRLEPAFFGLAIAPFVFIALGFLSRNPRAPRGVLYAMGLLLLVGLSLGLIDPLLGAAVGFALGGALVLHRPDVERVMYWRFGAVAFTGVYVLVLLVVSPAAGVFTAAVVPFILIGIADEYAAWSAARAVD